MKSKQRYIPDILEDILKELKKINKGDKDTKKKKIDPEIEAIIDEWEKDNKKIEKRQLPNDLH